MLENVQEPLFSNTAQIEEECIDSECIETFVDDYRSLLLFLLFLSFSFLLFLTKYLKQKQSFIPRGSFEWRL